MLVIFGLVSQEDKSSPEFGKRKLIWYHQKGILEPAPQVEWWPGSWRESDNLCVSGKLKLHLGNGMRLCTEDDVCNSGYALDFNGRSGLHCGEWLSCGEDNMAGDQVLKETFEKKIPCRKLTLSVMKFAGGR